MAVKMTFSGSQQIIQEFCEHCLEPIRILHISQIATIKENDPRTVKIRDKTNSLYTLKKRRDRIKEITGSFKLKGLLDDAEAAEAFTKKELKYGMRPEAMCSESIDTVSGVTSSYCYKTTNAKFLAKTSGSSNITFNAKFNATSEEKYTQEKGTKVGIDRKGNIIRTKAFKKINMDTGIPEEDALIKYKGPFLTAWWRALTPTQQAYITSGVQELASYIRVYGAEVKYMTVVARYRGRAEMITDVNSKGGRLR